MTDSFFLANLGIESLNEMQQRVIDTYTPSNDTILLSPTGSGKTLAFSLIIEKRITEPQKGIQSLIIAPTRELALQITSVVRKMPNCQKTTCIYGGNDLRSERNKLMEAPTILVGTPGRIIYHLERQHIDLSTVNTLVLDEFDKSLELGFQDQMQQIIQALGNPYRILTSATNIEELPEFLSLKDPIKVDFLAETAHKPDIEYRKITTVAQKKLDALFRLICKIQDHKMLIFCNHRDAVDHISELLSERDIIHDVFHGGLEQYDREIALLKFRNGTNRILITTDLAARGLDIPEVEAIIHYQLPSKEDAFTHRNGRTARMHAKGTVYIILKSDDNFAYLSQDIPEEELEASYPIPPNTEQTTLMINVGKKNKVNKIDVVGFLLNLPNMDKEDLGLIEIKEKHAFFAINRKKANSVLQVANNSKIKGNKIRIYRI